MTKKTAHLVGFVQHGVNSHATGMWRHPKDKINWDWTRPPYWQHMARTMERGLFDAMFIADELAPYNNYEGSSDATVKYAVQCPVHEPSTIVPIIATATTNLGVGVTLSTAFEHPYSMVRRLSSLDHLSSGRIAWNIVSSYSKSEWDAYGVEMTQRSGRYERMEEYMELCYKLWDSWEPDAIVANRDSGVFADPTKVHEVNHVGEFFRSRGRSFVCRSPQGRPVLWQAGSSDRGRDFAAKHAEAIFAVHPNVERMRAYSDDLNARLETGFAREPGSVKKVYGVQTIVGLSRSEAQEKYERVRECIPLEGATAWISGHFGPDFSKYDPDEIVQNIEIPGIQGLFDSIIYAKGGAPVTVREAALIYAEGMGMPRLVGTAADIADQLEYFLDEGGADGFMLAATYTPGCFEEFVDLVVPELQRRGRYRTRYSGSTLRENLLAQLKLSPTARNDAVAPIFEGQVHAVNAVAKPIAPCSTPSLKDAMRLGAGGVAVITAGQGGERTGLTVTSALSLSLDPPTMIVCVNRNASTLPVVERRRHFCVNVLAAEHEHVADRFAGRGGINGTARYECAQWRTLATGALALDGALAAIDCEVEELVERHSHVILIGAARAVIIRPGEPLVYSQGGYRKLAQP